MTINFPLTVRNHMTAAPVTIGEHQTLAEAHALMRAHGIRHLPVVAGTRPVGLVSERDLAMVEDLPGVDPKQTRIEESMTTDLHVVSPDAPLRLAVAEMADHKLGSALVVEHGAVVGVFTAVDACRTLALALSLLAERT
jgi:acetoin utilization protein AcuB